LINDLVDLFIAGMETTSSSLMCTFLYMIHHPEIQQKVHKELDKVKRKTLYILKPQKRYIYISEEIIQIFNVGSKNLYCPEKNENIVRFIKKRVRVGKCTNFPQPFFSHFLKLL